MEIAVQAVVQEIGVGLGVLGVGLHQKDNTILSLPLEIQNQPAPVIGGNDDFFRVHPQFVQLGLEGQERVGGQGQIGTQGVSVLALLAAVDGLRGGQGVGEGRAQGLGPGKSSRRNEDQLGGRPNPEGAGEIHAARGVKNGAARVHHLPKAVVVCLPGRRQEPDFFFPRGPPKGAEQKRRNGQTHGVRQAVVPQKRRGKGQGRVAGGGVPKKIGRQPGPDSRQHFQRGGRAPARNGSGPGRIFGKPANPEAPAVALGGFQIAQALRPVHVGLAGPTNRKIIVLTAVGGNAHFFGRQRKFAGAIVPSAQEAVVGDVVGDKESAGAKPPGEGDQVTVRLPIMVGQPHGRPLIINIEIPIDFPGVSKQVPILQDHPAMARRRFPGVAPDEVKDQVVPHGLTPDRGRIDAEGHELPPQMPGHDGGGFQIFVPPPPLLVFENPVGRRERPQFLRVPGPLAVQKTPGESPIIGQHSNLVAIGG